MSPDSEAIAASLETPASFGLVFDRHFDAIHGYLRRHVGPDLADELASQTFLIAFDKRGAYDVSRTSARPWLFGIATNLLRHHHRDVKRELRAYARTGVDPAFDAFDGVEARLDALDMGPELAGVISRIPAEELEALALFAWADLSYFEIAETLALPIGTVRSRLHRARRRLRELLEAGRAITDTAAS